MLLRLNRLHTYTNIHWITTYIGPHIFVGPILTELYYVNPTDTNYVVSLRVPVRAVYLSVHILAANLATIMICGEKHDNGVRL